MQSLGSYKIKKCTHSRILWEKFYPCDIRAGSLMLSGLVFMYVLTLWYYFQDRWASFEALSNINSGGETQVANCQHGASKRSFTRCHGPRKSVLL